MADLSRVGAVGLELTREEVADLVGALDGVIRKAQCREVNCDVLDCLTAAKKSLEEADDAITEILEWSVEDDN